MLATAGLALAASAVAPSGLKQLHGHVPQAVSHLTSLGQLSATNQMHLTIGLPLHNREALTNLLRQVYDPNSPNFHHFLTPDEFSAQFGPTVQDYQAVLQFARSNGLTITHTHGNRMSVGVTAKASDVERAFHVSMRKFSHPKDARNFYAPNTEPSVDANLPILSVQGLNNYVQPHPLLERMPASKIKPAAGTGPGGGYMGTDFRTAYLPGSTLNGAGQIVGLMQFDGYFASDITTYEALAGYTNVPLQNVLLDGFDGSPGANNDEVCLDIETVISMAPALSKVVVFEAGPFGNPNDILSAMAASNSIKQFSASWGYSIDGTTEQLYQQLALQGQTFLNASGDGDAWVGAIPYGSCEDANITIVGGTTLTMNGTAVSYASEKVWNWGFAGGFGWNPLGYVGSSGGISTDVNLPTWQQGISMANNHGSTTFRNVPDVALTGDNVFVVSSGGSYGIFGGTSCASPLWAGFMALVNQQAAANNKPSIGFLAPQVYALAKTANYTNAFHDIITGDNTWPGSPTNFFAVAGYDLATGLGTPNGTNFINAIAGGSISTGPIISAPSTWSTNLSVMNGSNPNGDWFLFIKDNKLVDTGIISNGWYVTLTTANPVGFASDNASCVTPTNTSVAVGAHWNVVLSITNYGPSISSNVLVVDTFNAPGLTLVTNTPSSGLVTNYGPSFTWGLGNLPVNAGASLTLSFIATAVGTYTNIATVTSDTTDPNSDDDVAVATLTAVTPTPPALTPTVLPHGAGFQLSVTGNDGLNTTVQASTNLVNWVNLFTGVSPFVFTDTSASNYPSRFYRAIVGP